MKHVLAVLFFAVPLMAQFGGARRVTPQGATLPAKCATGDLFQKTGASAGLYNCSGPDTWVAAAGGSGTTLPSQTGNSGKFLTTDGTNAAWAAIAAASAGVDVSAATSATITHNYGSKDVGAWCRDASDNSVMAGTVTNATVNTITLTFSPTFTGRCWAQPSFVAGGSGGGGSGTVTSVGLTAPSEFSVSGSPVTASGALALSWANQTQAKVLASPASATGAPSFRALVASDLPSHNAATATALETARTIMGISFNGTANIGSRSGNTTEFATVSGTKTTGKQLQFDASGNIAASSTDIGAGSGGSSSPTLIAFAGETSRTVTAVTHGLGTTPVFLGCRRTSDGVWTDGAAYTTNSSGDVTINPAAGSAYTGSCYIGGPPSGSLVLMDPNIVPTRITGAASLSMSTFGSSSCEEGNITVSGAAVGDEVMIGAPTGLGMGLIWSAYVSSANTVTLRVCRVAGSATISAQTFRATIVRSF